MGAFKSRLKTIAWFLTMLTLLQSCVAYHSSSTLESASQQKIRTKVTNTNGKNFRYRYITNEEGQFYGMSRKSGKWIKTPLFQKDIDKVYTESKGATIIGTGLLSAAALYGIGLLFYVYE